MISKIYLLLLVVFAAIITGISFYAHSWLQSIGDPVIASNAYLSQSSFGWTFLWVSFLVLAVFSLYMTWKSGVKWAVCLAMGYFVLFSSVILYNDLAYKSFLADNLLVSPQTLLNPLFAAVMFLIVGLALIAAYMVTSNLRLKIKVKTGKADENDKKAK